MEYGKAAVPRCSQRVRFRVGEGEPVVLLDTSFDFRTDSRGRDPDTHSPTLRSYHRVLWSKVLPNGIVFELAPARGAYLHHQSQVGEFWLASDSVMQTFTRWAKLAHITGRLPQHMHDEFQRIGYTIGGMMLFPGNTVDRKMTINGARGFTSRIADRMDLTLECIRRHYLGQVSPLADVLARYDDFFALFGTFAGYVDFFLLQDLVESGCDEVRFFMPFDDFTTPAIPGDLATYVEFRARSMEFVSRRNGRIDQLRLNVPSALLG
jgi:hypothetical protein